ncbi:hypothetical protein OG393_30825 [Streptomyces sp. NBC_01216]|uniref:hypothetical protein n=1 Tax=Streptomyces sp. NBC_01216 TaxID=2903778 RepID=UPI002E16006B|nr:hypothetical protein OG393_30825 [Streptomyces sp. NBC_01216]
MYPTLFTTPGVKDFAEAIDAERQAQLAKFGDQKHPDGTGLPFQKHAARRYRQAADDNAAAGVLRWRDVLLEEVHEALAEADPARLLAELVQVAAVCAAWVRDIDTRPHSMVCGHCGQPIPVIEGQHTWHGPVPLPGQPECTVPRFHLGREYPECRNAS